MNYGKKLKQGTSERSHGIPRRGCRGESVRILPSRVKKRNAFAAFRFFFSLIDVFQAKRFLKLAVAISPALAA